MSSCSETDGEDKKFFKKSREDLDSLPSPLEHRMDVSSSSNLHGETPSSPLCMEKVIAAKGILIS